MKTIKHLDDNLGYDHDPDQCPICHQGIQPRRITSSAIYDGDRVDILQIFYVCPRRDCQRAFIATYRQRWDRYGYPDGEYLLKGTAPYRPPEPSTPDEIKAISPTYASILSQSSAAEHWELDQIAGAGYRKAIEYLIKDYASHKNPSNSEQIKHAWLGEVITKYITDANVKACASRAAWLGNDEVHYARKWTDKDVDDLKILIRLSEAWILNDILTAKYLEDMRPK